MTLCIGLLLSSTPAWAQAAGSSIFQFGWLHIRPQESNNAPNNRLRSNPLFAPLGIDETFRSESVKITAPSADTLGLIFKQFFTDHLAVTVVGGIPRKSALRADGVVGPTGPTRPANSLDVGREDFNPVGSARQWSPILLAEYHFRAPNAAWRPYIGVGFSYLFFTEIELNENFEAAINQTFGTPLAVAAARPGPTETNTNVEDTFAAAFTAGISARLSDHWSLTSSVIYLPLSTTGTVTLDAQDGTRLATSKTRLHFDPLVISLLLGYQF